MSNLLATTQERVYFKDRQSRFLFVSAGWVAAYAPGRTPEELTGKTDFDIFSNEHASAAFADEQQIIRTGRPVVGHVERETYSGREDAWVSTTKMPLQDSRGQIIGTFGISRDVTAQITAELALARQAQELSAQNERLRELDRLKDEFIALVSHELRTPLTSIIGYTKLLRDERADGGNARHFTEVIERNAERLLRLVGDLLFLSQIQSGKLGVELRSTDLAGLVAHAVEEGRPEAERKHIDLTLATAAVPRCAVDPTRIAQLLRNLISNAVKFTPDGGKVEVGLGTEEDQAVLTVADTGIGIPAADRERIFERFFRTATATREVIPGTGLGLTITKAIVEAHNGTISVDSDEGRGSTFTVRLPLRPAAAPATRGRADAGTERQDPAGPAGGGDVRVDAQRRGVQRVPRDAGVLADGEPEPPAIDAEHGWPGAGHGEQGEQPRIACCDGRRAGRDARDHQQDEARHGRVPPRQGLEPERQVR
ncbi:MAG TPA: PAS domain-containing sensor histidine kinase [Streptosporangiaceae bacterium]|nr:PAS domain-containing sensor histidine kinase [Streptosporangiaceae bacterium]